MQNILVHMQIEISVLQKKFEVHNFNLKRGW